MLERHECMDGFVGAAWTGRNCKKSTPRVRRTYVHMYPVLVRCDVLFCPTAARRQPELRAGGGRRAAHVSDGHQSFYPRGQKDKYVREKPVAPAHFTVNSRVRSLLYGTE